MSVGERTLAIVVALAWTACGPARGPGPGSPAGGRAAGELACARPVPVPISTDFHLVFFELTVAGRPTVFLLDTGADESLLDAGRATALGLHPDAPERVAQPGGEIEVGRVARVALAIGAATWSMPIRTAPIAPLARFVGRPVDGVLGHDAISRFVIEIDYRAHRMTLCDPTTARYVGHGTRVPLVVGPTGLDGGAALVDATLTTLDDREVPARLKLDTGGMLTVGLAANFARDAGLPPAGQPALADPGIALGGSTEGQTFRIAALRLGDQSLRDLPIGVTTSGAFADRPYAGTLAGEVLARFRVVLDYPHRAMYLTPGPDVAARFPYDAAGWLATSVPGSGRIELALVIAGGPAAMAGLRVGDVLVAIDGRPVPALHALWTLTRRPGRHTLRYERGGVVHATTLRLRERI